MNKIKPLADRVLIEPSQTKGKTSGGLIIPEGSKKKTKEGVVLAVGPGTLTQKPVLKVGDKVLFGKAGTAIELDDRLYLLMKESDVYAII